MINFFNRKELAITDSVDRQAEVRNMLAQHHIDYTVKVINRSNQIRNCPKEYIIYVKKDKFERALQIIRMNE